MVSSAIAQFLRSTIADLENDVDLFNDLLSQGEGYDRKVRVLAYAGYRNRDRLRLKGRVVRYEKPLDAGEGLGTRLRAMLEIYNSNEIPGVPVRCDAFGQASDAVTDDEGYFDFELALDRPLPLKTTW